MSANTPERFDDVSVICRANIYFDGQVISHTVLLKDGKKKTIGLIFPGTFMFNTDAPEKMEITAGSCRVLQKDDTQWKSYPAGTFFMVPGKSSFEITVDEGILEYICSFE
jgi:purine/pyrimidine-nucleoside phosphorylase